MSIHSQALGVDVVKLIDIAAIRQGVAFRSKLEHDPDGKISVVQAKDIGADVRLDLKNVARLKDLGFSARHRLALGDVVIQARGVNYPVALVEADLGEAIAAAPLYVIRCNDDRTSAAYLAQYLAHPATQSQLRLQATGTYVPQLSRAAINEIEILLPPPDEQYQFIELMLLVKRERELSNRLSDLRLKELWARLTHGTDVIKSSRGTAQIPQRRTKSANP
jgi:hypothetical protein